VELCHKEKSISIIVDNLKDIENISKDWKLSVQERRDLYKTCARILDENNEA
jgi:hypothetical protein